MMNKDISVSVIMKPARKVIIKRAEKATDYFDYCVEVGCSVWQTLKRIDSISPEPVCLRLPKSLISPGTSAYVHGAEVAPDFSADIPDGYDAIRLPACEYLMFQGSPFIEDEFESAIEQVADAISSFDPSSIGYQWDEDNPRILLEPIGSRGFIEMVPIKRLST